jgi:2-keto-4-pentenoate hydratase/2-oxohepta-3-ene-1,7-dioic acid hydratase in catechol pathway
MKIVRFLDSNKQVKCGSLQADNTALEITGDIFGKFSVGNKSLKIGKLLAPVEPVVFLCIGLNYRRHAEECKATLPQFPVLFM